MDNHSVTKKEGWEIFEVLFENFVGLRHSTGVYVSSPEFTCFGHKWCLALYPGGELTLDGEPSGSVSIYLTHKSDGEVEVYSSLAANIYFHRDMGKYKFPPRGSADDSWGETDFNRSSIIDTLRDGALVVEVRMRQVEPSTTSPSEPFIPENPLCKIMLSKFMDEESADVVFEVGDEAVTSHGTRKRAKTTTTFHAHRFILQECAPQLVPCGTKEGDEVTTIPITDVKPEIFHHMLYYVYGGKVPDDELKANARDIIDAADRYGVVHLKLEAEACFVQSTTIKVNNMMDHLHYAVSKNCALLQEAVMDFVVDNGSDVLKDVSFDNIPGGSSLFVDLIAALTRDKVKESDTSKNKKGEDLNTMRVSDLRKRLHEKGLDIDGSRKAMIATLKESLETKKKATA